VANVDYATGAFVPASGRGVKVDTNTALVTTYGNGRNGPSRRWALSWSTPSTCPTSPERRHRRHRRGHHGELWTNEMLDDSLQRISPIATLDLSNPPQ
jgi:hypothetical protein